MSSKRTSSQTAVVQQQPRQHQQTTSVDPSMWAQDLPGAGNAMARERMGSARTDAASPGLLDIAADGMRGAGSALPHLTAIQEAFGHHDVSDVTAHAGPSAREATDRMGANAYATGSHVVGDGLDLHTAAHEAAHVVQQRGGVQLSGGVGQSGDVYERHADAVADAVVRGESAEGLLDRHASSGSRTGHSDAVQRDNKPWLSEWLEGQDKGPPSVDWGGLVSPTAGAVPSGSWGEQPAMKNSCNARCHGPTEGPEAESWNGSLVFMQQWATVQGSYNRVSELAAQSDIKSVLEPSTQPWSNPPTLLEPNPMPWFDPSRKKAVKAGAGSRVPDEGGTSDIDGAFDAGNAVDVGRGFDLRGLEAADQQSYTDAKKAALDARGGALDKKVNVDMAMTNVGTAFSKVAQANITVKKAEAEGDKQSESDHKVQVGHARSKIEARVKAASTIFTGLVDAKTGASGGDKAKGGAQAVEGALTLAVSEHYGHRLAEIDRYIGSLNQTISSLSVKYEMEAVTQAVNEVTNKKAEVVKARIALDAAIRAQNDAFNKLGQVVETLAKKQGRNDIEAENLRTAAAAIPHIEQVLSSIAQIQPNISLPMYTAQSGLGAGQCTNLSSFTRHYSELFGFGMEIPTLKAAWEARLASAKKVLGLSLPTY